MYSENRGDADAKLTQLFQTYRQACPVPEPSANFMPEIWRRVEERQRSLSFLSTWARALATTAAVLSLAMAAYMYTPRAHQTTPSESYVEMLAGGHPVDGLDATELTSDEL